MGERRYFYDKFCSTQLDCISESSDQAFPQSIEDEPLPSYVDQSAIDGFSFHLMYGIEVERPFDDLFC